MNISELARRLKVPLDTLRAKLPELGFDIGLRALKVDDRVVGKIIIKWRDYERLEREKAKWTKVAKKEEQKEGVTVEVQREIKLPLKITVRDFAVRLGMPINAVIKELMNNGILASLNDYIDYETAAILSEDFSFKVTQETEEEKKDEWSGKQEIVSPDEPNLLPRPPVVVVMGHVDHGKTKLLDAIRKTNVIAGEAGGITQHIGAYQAKHKNQIITFIDTPGHEAFTTMRSRGARIADIAILVVAADDGVQPQTREALKIIQAAKIPFVVAINKVDKPEINLDKVKAELAELGLAGEDWGGQTIMAPISAKTGQNIEGLLETILLIYELEQSKIVANPSRRAVGTIIESHVDPRSGVTATMLVQNGTLRLGDYLSHRNILLGKVRNMSNWNGQLAREAPPAMPVKILGLKVPPDVGDIVEVPEKPALLERKVRLVRQTSHAIVSVSAPKPAEASEKIYLNIIVRADVLGSLEAIAGSLEKIGSEKLAVKAISQGLGNITDADILRAESATARIYGFHVLVPPDAANLAREKNVQIKIFEIIYDLLDAVKADLETLVPEEIVVTYLGKLKIKAVFRTERDNQIAGGVATDGKLLVGGKARILRADSQIGEGLIVELQSGKTPAREVRGGSECGIKLKTRTKLQAGDELEVYIEEKKKMAQ